MNDESAAVLPIWMLIAAAFGFIVGHACGNYRRRLACLEQINDDLRQRLDQAKEDVTPIQSTLKQQRSIINDIHSRLVAVSKGLQKRPS